MSGSSGIDQAKASSAQRLRNALGEMAMDSAKPTASALCEKAGISRNALYRYHADALHELHKLQHQSYREPSTLKLKLEQLRRDNDAMHLKVAQLVALVDHYFAAWQERSALLERRERELSDLRKGSKSRVVPIRSAGAQTS